MAVWHKIVADLVKFLGRFLAGFGSKSGVLGFKTFSITEYLKQVLKLSSQHQKYFYFAKKNKNHGKICGKESSIGAQLLPDC